MKKGLNHYLSMALLAFTVLLISPALLTEAASNDSCGPNATWDLTDDGILTIKGSGEVNKKPWSSHKDDIYAVIIEEGITSIPNKSFENHGNLYLASLPSTLTSGGKDAFSYTSLHKVTFSNSATIIPDNMFRDCSNLTIVTLPDSITSIGKWAFSGCSELSNITLPKKLKHLGQEAFASTKISSITIPESLTSCEWRPFYGSSLSKVTFSGKRTQIPSYLFSDCKNLTNITIPESVTKIGNGAFQYCNQLSKINIPSSVTHIGDWVFSDCWNLSKVILPSKLVSLGKYAFIATPISSVIIPYTCKSIGMCAFETSNRDSFTIYGAKNSAAYTYAKKFKYTFKTYHFLGASYTINNGLYKITKDSASNGTVTFVKPSKKTYKSFSIPSKVKIAGRTYTVNAIGVKAFAGCKKLKSVTIPTSCKTIASNALKDSKIKTIYGSKSSAAFTFAKKNKIKFVAK